MTENEHSYFKKHKSKGIVLFIAVLHFKVTKEPSTRAKAPTLLQVKDHLI